MGQAKKRGTFEQRQQAAYERIDAQTELLVQARAHNDELARLERESEAMMSTNAAQFITSYWEHTRLEDRIMSKTALDLVIQHGAQ